MPQSQSNFNSLLSIRKCGHTRSFVFVKLRKTQVGVLLENKVRQLSLSQNVRKLNLKAKKTQQLLVSKLPEYFI